MGSFKLKLVLWFALLALLPLGGRVLRLRLAREAQRDRRVDAASRPRCARAVAGYAGPPRRGRAAAAQLAADPRLQRALRGHDRAALRRSSPACRARRSPRRRARSVRSVTPAGVPHRDRGRPTGARSGASRSGSRSTTRCSRRLGAGLAPGDRLVAVAAAASSPAAAAGSRSRHSPIGRTAVQVGVTEYRGAATAPLTGHRASRSSRSRPSARSTRRARTSERGMLAALLALARR